MFMKKFFVYAVALLALSQYAGAQLLPTVPTNLPNVRTYVAPPAGFNPVAASDATLAQYGFPPRPNPTDDPAANAAWNKAMSAPQKRLTNPQLELTNLSNGTAQLRPSNDKSATELAAATPKNIAFTTS